MDFFLTEQCSRLGCNSVNKSLHKSSFFRRDSITKLPGGVSLFLGRQGRCLHFFYSSSFQPQILVIKANLESQLKHAVFERFSSQNCLKICFDEEKLIFLVQHSKPIFLVKLAKGAACNQFRKIPFLALKHHSVEKKGFYDT